MGLSTRTAGAGQFEQRVWQPSDPFLLVLAVLCGVALIVVATPLGSGDYGQWLMTARSYAGESFPDYRAEDAVPPVVPILLGYFVSIVGDALVAIRLFAVFILCALGASAYFAGSTLFRSPRTGLLATVLALLVVDQFLDLFAFGGLLQAAAILLAWLAVAAFVRAVDGSRREWLWWTFGSVCVGLIALTHVGSAYTLVPTCCAVAVLAVRNAGASRKERLLRLTPLGVVLLVALAFWLLVLVPGGTDLIRNPASLSYRGPNRLVESLSEHWPTAAVAAGGLMAILMGALLEVRRARHGKWIFLASWTAITLGALFLAVLTRASTDYPRFATPILAPLVIGAAAAVSAGVGLASRGLAKSSARGTAANWSVVILAAGIVVCAPFTADRFIPEASGYRLQDAEDLAAAATWIETHLGEEATVLAPVREAKWLEGLTGRPALFSSPVRYSFRAEEWQRSLAADALLRSNGAVVNQFFFTRMTAAGADQSAARGVVIAANHGGEYVDLLTTVPENAQVIGTGTEGPVLATLANLAPAGRDVTIAADEIRVASAWVGERQAASVTYTQIVTLTANSSVMRLSVKAETTLPNGGLQIELRPASGIQTTAIDVGGREATLSFRQLGSGEPRLRVMLAGDEGYLQETAAGGLRIGSLDSELHLLITDLTAADSASSTLQWLDPTELVDRYGVKAVLLASDPSLDGRVSRLAVLGFQPAQDFGSYVLLLR